MSYESQSFGSFLSSRSSERSRKISIKKMAYLAWLMFLAMAIYAFPLYGAIYPPEGTWFDSEQFWFSLFVIAGWPIAAFYIIRWQWRSSEDPLAHCIRCGTEIPETSNRCRQCGQRVSVGEAAEIAGFIQLTQDGSRQR